MVSAGHVGGTRGSGIASSASSVVDECRAWDERSWWSAWDLYVFDSGRRGSRGGEWMRGLGLGFSDPVGTGDVLGVCLCCVVVVCVV